MRKTLKITGVTNQTQTTFFLLVILSKYLELDVILVLLYPNSLGVLPAGQKQKLLDLLDFSGHFGF